MTYTIAQIDNALEIAKMRMDQARDKLCDAIVAGNNSEEARLELVHAASVADFKDLKADRAACGGAQ